MMISKRSGKISAALFVMWAGTMLWVLDTRVNFTQRSLKDGECPCALALASNRTPATKDIASSSTKVKTRTVVKWLNYCKDSNASNPSDSKKAEAPPKKTDAIAKEDEVRKHSNATSSERTRQKPVEQKPVEQKPVEPVQGQQLKDTQQEQQQRQGETLQQRQGETPQQRQGETPQQRQGETPQQRQGETPQQRQGETPQQHQGETLQQQQQQHQEIHHQQLETQERQQETRQQYRPQQQDVEQPQQVIQQQQPRSGEQNEADHQYQLQQQQKQQQQQHQQEQQPGRTGQELAKIIQQQPQRPLEPSPSEKVMNPHPYSFVMKNADACVKGANPEGYVDVLCLVYTAPSDSYMRSLIRKTWASAKEVKGKRIVTMFLLGQRNLEIQQLIELENNLYHDIIQEDFTDSYYNLTIKTIMGLKWASHYCSNARFIMKMDIDMFVNVYNLVDRIEKTPTSGLAEGNRKDVTKPIRYKQSKRYTSKDVYPADSYPPYLNGPAYLMSADVAPRIYQESFHTHFLPWEDAFIGIIMKKMHVKPKYNGMYDSYLNYTNEQETLKKISGSITFHLGEDKDRNKVNIVKVWKYVQKLNGVSL